MRAFIALMMGSLLAVPVLAQQPAHRHGAASESFTCNYTGASGPQVLCDYLAYNSNGYAERVVERILKPIGLMRNFKVIECANTQNCFATVVQGQRFIIYDGAFMQRIEDMTETDWSAVSIMAHEIGHHLQGHTIDGRGGQPQKGLEADKFSGFVLHQLGASLEESLIAIRALGSEYATTTHPAKVSRLNAIKVGWQEAEELYPRRAVANRPALSSNTAGGKVTAPRTSVGCVSGNCDEGAGVLVYQNRERYEGEFAEGSKHGQGVEYYADGKPKYKGTFKSGSRYGFGTYYYQNGDRYIGQFQSNVPNGKGTYYYSDGDRFVGSFRNGRRQGYGVLYGIDGSQEPGEYVNDEKVR